MTKQKMTTHRRPWIGSRLAFVAALAVMLATTAMAQTDTNSNKNAEDTGQVWNGYAVTQSVEFGGRITDVSGNLGVYRTFVNLQSGPRLLDYSLNMRSLTRNGTLFDDLSMSNTGYGGDPNDFSRLRISKNRWYDFSAQFRRDVNYFNYTAFANPYNWGGVAGVAAAPLVQWNDSVHVWNTRRKMGDFNLTLAPQSPIRVRLGYSRNDNTGPSFSSFHEGTDIQLFQDFANRQDRYQIGVDLKVAPRTTLSYDQFWIHNKVNTWWQDRNVGNANIPLGPVDVGAIWYPYYGQPCATAAVTGGVGGTLTPATCTVWGSYFKSSPVRTNLPTEQVSFNSNYFKRVDFNGSFSYTSGESKIANLSEIANTNVGARTNVLAFTINGPVRVKRIASHGDFGFTIHLSESWAVSNQTRYLNYRHPGSFDSTEESCFPNAAGATVLSPVGVGVLGGSTCAGRPAVGTPIHVAGSPADLLSEAFVRQFAERQVFNTTRLSWEPAKQFKLNLGYRFGNVKTNYTAWDSSSATYLGPVVGTRPVGIVATPAPGSLAEATENDLDSTEHAGLLGIVLRPVDAWRINADAEWLYATTPLTPTWPQHVQTAKVRTTYRVAPWATFSASANFYQNRNDWRPVGPEFNPNGAAPLPTQFIEPIAFPVGIEAPAHRDHARAYSVGLTLEPAKQFTFDIGYTFNNAYSRTGSCLMVSGGPAGLTPEGGAIARCANVAFSAGPLAAGEPVSSLGGSAIPSVLHYSQDVHNAYANLIFHPVERFSLTFGMDFVTDNGGATWLRADTLAPLRVPVDAAGNVVYTGNVLAGPAVGFAPGPNPWQPQGTSEMKWLRPNAAMEIGISRAVALKAGWNYYDYHEFGYQGPVGLSAIAPRNFNANVATLSVKYAF